VCECAGLSPIKIKKKANNRKGWEGIENKLIQEKR
jgi:hypothetical protein